MWVQHNIKIQHSQPRGRLRYNLHLNICSRRATYPQVKLCHREHSGYDTIITGLPLLGRQDRSMGRVYCLSLGHINQLTRQIWVKSNSQVTVPLLCTLGPQEMGNQPLIAKLSPHIVPKFHHILPQDLLNINRHYLHQHIDEYYSIPHYLKKCFVENNTLQTLFSHTLATRLKFAK